MPRLTVTEFAAAKTQKRPLVVVTAYDYPTARIVDSAGVDAVLVGDSLAMVVQGRENTLKASLDAMVYHAEMVGRAVERALVVVDLPFPTYHLGAERAIEAAGRVLRESRSQAVKLEGGEDVAATIRALVAAGVPVMGHVGLRPQSIHTMGGYRVQRDRDRLLADARAAADAGAFAVVLECVPAEIAGEITELLPIPTIGIGAGARCDGQVLVFHDIVGLASGYVPRFVKAYADLEGEIRRAVGAFADEVRSGAFPGPEQSYQ